MLNILHCMADAARMLLQLSIGCRKRRQLSAIAVCKTSFKAPTKKALTYPSPDEAALFIYELNYTSLIHTENTQLGVRFLCLSAAG